MYKFAVLLLLLASLACSPLSLFGAEPAQPVEQATTVATATTEAQTRLREIASPTVVAKIDELKVYEVTVGFLNIRECAGIDCNVITTLKKGDTIEVMECDAMGQWCKVIYGHVNTGWVNSAFTSIEDWKQ